VFAKIVTLIFDDGFPLKGRAFAIGFVKLKINLLLGESKQ
jgi:hypothetical protein